MSSFRPVASDLFFSRKDPTDPRLGELVRSSSDEVQANAWTIAGYPDDEGIRLNVGRPGAAGAPTTIRRWLYKMTPSVQSDANIHFIDRGDLNAANSTLGERHEIARAEARRTLKAGGKWLGLGGGHDYGFSDGAGFLDSIAGGARSPLLINFDAHLDVRPDLQGPHSGTPFYRLLEAFPGTELIEIGIQNQCNSRTHLKWLHDRGGRILSLDDLTTSDRPAGVVMRDFLQPFVERPRPIFLSVDLDAFASAYAPGCSQSWPTGLEPNEVIGTIDFICRRGDVRAAGLYEVSPPLDVDDRTSRLAALIAHRLLFTPHPDDDHAGHR